MRNRSDLYGLMAKREEMKQAKAAREVGKIAQAQSHAEALTERLRSILAERQVKGPVLAAQLQSTSTLSGKIAAEAAIQSQKARELAEAVAQSRAKLAEQSHKAQYLSKAATDTRRIEQDDRETRQNAALSTGRR